MRSWHFSVRRCVERSLWQRVEWLWFCVMALAICVPVQHGWDLFICDFVFQVCLREYFQAWVCSLSLGIAMCYWYVKVFETFSVHVSFVFWKCGFWTWDVLTLGELVVIIWIFEQYLIS